MSKRLACIVYFSTVRWATKTLHLLPLRPLCQSVELDGPPVQQIDHLWPRMTPGYNPSNNTAAAADAT